MGESNLDLFQDRTPRPFINFENMNEAYNIVPFITKGKNNWVEHYAKCAIKRIEKPTMCQQSWQDDMVEIMKKLIIDDYVRNTSEQQFKIDKISLQVENTNILAK
jgi:hypothetical protein